MREHLKTWREGGFTLAMWDTGIRDNRGQNYIEYKLWDAGKLIFHSDDFSGSPMHADDSDLTVASLLGFLSLQYGDTDREYFDGYTPAQIAWMQSRAEELSYFQHDLEERAEAEYRESRNR